jgi:hypothetical protein
MIEFGYSTKVSSNNFIKLKEIGLKFFKEIVEKLLNFGLIKAKKKFEN